MKKGTNNLALKSSFALPDIVPLKKGAIPRLYVTRPKRPGPLPLYAGYYIYLILSSNRVRGVRGRHGAILGKAFTRFWLNSPTFRSAVLTVAKNPNMINHPIIKGTLNNIIASTKKFGLAEFKNFLMKRAAENTAANTGGMAGPKKDITVQRPQKTVSKMSDNEIIAKGRDIISGNLNFAKVSPIDDDAKTIIKAKTGYDLSGYNITFENSELRHLFKYHGDNTLVPRSKYRPIGKSESTLTINDLPIIASIPNNFDDVFTSSIYGKGNAPRLVFIKDVGNNFVVITEIRTKYGNLVPFTAFKMDKKDYSKELVEDILHKLNEE